MENIQAVITQQAGKIECNFEQVEKGIRERLAEYEGVVFTEDSKIYAKKEITGLRKEQGNLKIICGRPKNLYGPLGCI